MNQLNRRRVFAVFAAAPFALRAGATFAQDDDVEALLQTASETMAALSSFHFHLETIEGSATILGALELREVEGDVDRPASFQATVTAKLAVADVTVDIVSIDGAVWVTNPMSNGDWEQLSTGQDEQESAELLTILINPESIFLTAITVLKNPEIDKSEDIGGIQATRIVGSFIPADLAELIMAGTPQAQDGEESEEVPIQLSSDPVDLTVWITEDGHVLQIEEEGPLTATESRDVIRRFTFSNFDQPVEITPPEMS